MPRVIRDSDDEFDEEDLETDTEAPVDATVDKNASTHQEPSLQSNEPGTGSTDSLKRAIEAAHCGHFQSPLDGPVPPISPQRYVPDAPFSLAQHSNKRRKTSLDASPRTSPGIASDQPKQIKTYGRSRTMLSSPLLEQLQDQRMLVHDQDTTNNIWGLDGTMRVDYAQHEPMALFPDQSSTIPNATLTQQRLLEEVMAPAFLGLEAETESDAPRYEPAKSSVPWSDYLKSPTDHTESQSHPTTGHELPSSHHGGSQMSPPEVQSGGPLNALSQYEERSQRSRRGSVPLKSSPLRQQSDPKDIAESHQTVCKVTSNGDHAASRLQSSQIIASSKGDPAPAKASQHNMNQKQTEAADVWANPKSRRKSSPIPTSDDYLESMGLLKEQYKPRPSRSRSMKTEVVEPADPSVRPEKSAKRTPKRRRTVEGGDHTDATSTLQKVKQICDMGFTPSTTQRALEKNKGDPNQTVEWLLRNALPDDHDELAPPRTSRTRWKARNRDINPDSSTNASFSVQQNGTTGAPQVTIEDDPSRAPTPEKIAHDIVSPQKGVKISEHKSPKVQVVIPPTSRSKVEISNIEEQQRNAVALKTMELAKTVGSGRKAKRRKTTLDQPEPTGDNDPPIVPEPVKGKKRGRGRPRKEVVAPLPDDTVTEAEQDRNSGNGEGHDIATTTVLRETQAKGPSHAETSTSRDTEDQTKPTSPPVTGPLVSTPSPMIAGTPAKVMETPDEQTKPANGIQSTLSNGKVPYRVGLSKRTRIAPLLKIVKK